MITKYTYQNKQEYIGFCEHCLSWHAYYEYCGYKKLNEQNKKNKLEVEGKE